MFNEFEKIRVLIKSNGDVHWEPGGVFATSCDIDILYFPFDTQVHEFRNVSTFALMVVLMAMVAHSHRARTRAVWATCRRVPFR